MGNQYFRFKKSVIKQDEKVFKVNTDGVLLAAWANIENANSLLEIGCGTGFISILLAQKNPSIHITAIDIQPQAAALTKLNVKANLPLTKNIICEEMDLLQFKNKEPYDIIISNPPFYENTTASNKESDKVAKHDKTLNLETLLENTGRMIHENTIFYLVLPKTEGEKFLTRILKYGWFLTEIMHVKPISNKAVHRLLLKLERNKGSLKIRKMTILNLNKQFSNKYQNLTKDFYINF